MRSEQNVDTQYRQKASTSIQRYYTNYAVQDGDVIIGKKELVDFLNITLPNYEFKLIDIPPFWSGRRLDNDQPVENSDQLSSGESQILSMAFDIMTQYSGLPSSTTEFKTLLIDEPDAHIHPDTQANFCKFIALLQARIGMNVVIATHSVEILGGLALHCMDRTACAIVRPSESQIRARPLEAMHSEALSALGGGILMGRLFGSRLLLVEGEDDHDVWSQAARSGALNGTVVPCGGGERMKKKQKLLEDLFSGLRDPAQTQFGVAILDGDKKLPQPSARNPQRYIKFYRLQCREIENLILSDEVLEQIGLNWTEVKTRFQNWSGKVAVARRLKTLCSSERKTFDLKGLMPILETIIFPDMGRWTRVVGNVLAKGRPTGQAAEFLGTALLDALYEPVPEIAVAVS